jgi:hypothetical protein
MLPAFEGGCVLFFWFFVGAVLWVFLRVGFYACFLGLVCVGFFGIGFFRCVWFFRSDFLWTFLG